MWPAILSASVAVLAVVASAVMSYGSTRTLVSVYGERLTDVAKKVDQLLDQAATTRDHEAKLGALQRHVEETKVAIAKMQVELEYLVKAAQVKGRRRSRETLDEEREG